MYVYAWEACESCSLVPLAKGGATIGTPSLTQCKAEEDTQGEEEDGTQDPQASEVILEDTNSVTQTHTHTHQKALVRTVWMGPLFIYLQHTLRAKAVIPAFKIFYLSHQPSLHLRLDLIFLSSVRIFWWVLTFITCVKQHFSELSSLSNYLSYEQRLMFWAKRSSRGNCSVGVWPHSWNRSSLLIWFNIITNKLKGKS